MGSKPSRVSIRDVARAANTGVSTVSRALNGRPDVSEETRERILTIARELNFELNPFARGLIRGETGLVGVIARYYEFRSDYSTMLFQGLVTGARRRRLEIVLSWAPRDGRQLEACASLQRRGFVEGAIVVSPLPHEEAGLQRLQQEGFPVVLVNSTSHLPGVSTVQPMDLEGSYAATQHLLGLGHTRIGIVTHATSTGYGRERYDGYTRALTEVGLPIDPRLVALDTTGNQQAGQATIAGWLNNAVPFTAVVCYNDLVAYGVYLELRARGIEVPDQVSIVGFDDWPMTRYIGPGITSVRQPIRAIGLSAMTMLSDIIQGKVQPGEQRKLQTSLRIRGSTAAPPAELL